MAFSDVGGIPRYGLPLGGWPDLGIPYAGASQRYEPPIISLHDGASAAHLRDVRSISFVQLAWNETGPDTATFGVPRSSDLLAADLLFPGGVPNYVRINPGDIVDADGVAFQIDTWTGRAIRPQGNSTAPTWQIQCEGPAAWLDEFALPPSWPRFLPAARLAAWSTEMYPAARVKMGSLAHRGAPVKLDPRAQGMFSLWSSCATDRGETFWISCDPDEIQLYLDWSSALARRDRRGEIVLEADTPGANVTWDPSYELWRPAGATIMAGWSASYGTTTLARSIRRAPGNVYGRSGSMTTSLYSPIARSLAGLPTTYRPDLATSRAIEQAQAARLRANMIPSSLVRVTVTKLRSSLFSLRPGDLVRCRWRDEPTGLYANGSALVTAKTVQLAPSLACEYALEVWGGD